MGRKFSKSLAVLALAASVALFPIALAAQANPADSNANRIAQENQQHEPHMAAALEHLRQAEQELQQAAANKGGHREQAINLTHQAMSEVEQGIQYYNQHVSPLGQGGAQPYNGQYGSEANTGLVRITSGPVIEHADQNSATVAWSTDREGSTTVEYGTDVNSLNQVAQAPWGAGGLTHRVELKNLQPGTRYFFEVETGQARGTNGGQVESRRYTFQTPNVGQPPIHQQQPQPVR